MHESAINQGMRMKHRSIQTLVSRLLNRKSKRHLLFGCLWLPMAICSSALSQTETTGGAGQEITPPENWYQVEVILFTQQGNTGNETAPQDYQLDFPESWRELIDPQLENYKGHFPAAKGALLSPSNNDPAESLSRLIPRAMVQDPTITASNSDRQEQPSALTIAQQRLAEARALDQQILDSQLTTTEGYQPRYEAPLLILENKFRDLNETGTTLDRRGYNVVFHEAWRFASDAEENDPWLLIKAGQSVEGRHEIEGAVRFYKSRFLHFETDLWLLQFDNDENQRINLPDFPAQSADLKASIKNSPELFLTKSPERSLLKSPERPLSNSPEQPLLKSPELPTTKNNNPSFTELRAQTAFELTEPKDYPVAKVWTLDKSMRLDEGEVYYIDHPRMGAIVTVKSYSPLLLNPQTIEETEEIEATPELLGTDSSNQ